MNIVTGGPDDGAGLYPIDRWPCLVCGRVVGMDWDGCVTWHMPGPELVDRSELIYHNWCPGSRQRWEVPT